MYIYTRFPHHVQAYNTHAMIIRYVMQADYVTAYIICWETGKAYNETWILSLVNLKVSYTTTLHPAQFYIDVITFLRSIFTAGLVNIPTSGSSVYS